MAVEGNYWPKALGDELTIAGAEGKWEALGVWAQLPGKVGLLLGMGVAVNRKKKKKRGMSVLFCFFFPFSENKEDEQ